MWQTSYHHFFQPPALTAERYKPFGLIGKAGYHSISREVSFDNQEGNPSITSEGILDNQIGRVYSVSLLDPIFTMGGGRRSYNFQTG